MNKTILLVLSAFVGLALAAGQGGGMGSAPSVQTVAEKHKAMKITGTVMSYTEAESMLVVQMHNMKEDTLQLTAKTMVMEKGKEIPFIDLAAGDRVAAWYMKENGKKMATKVEVIAKRK